MTSEAVLDKGLPPGQTRDGPWNTNNHIESGFRTLKVVFLELRKNKRCVHFLDDTGDKIAQTDRLQ
jgi:hypothetical protein